MISLARRETKELFVFIYVISTEGDSTVYLKRIKSKEGIRIIRGRNFCKFMSKSNKRLHGNMGVSPDDIISAQAVIRKIDGR